MGGEQIQMGSYGENQCGHNIVVVDSHRAGSRLHISGEGRAWV